MIKQLHSVCIFSLSIVLIMMASSCANTRKAIYFTDLDTLTVNKYFPSEFTEPLIQSNDILGITIQTIDPKATAPVNQNPNGDSLIQNSVSANGFLVDKAGNVELPMLGIVKLSGMTTSAAKEVIRREVAKYYKNPTVQVRINNYKVTVIGEVAKPATYNVANEKVSVLDAISLAGDLTIFGKRNNVMLIRDNGTNKEVVRLDLSSSKIMLSPYFYMKQNDVLYVEPNKARVEANNAPKYQMISIAISVATLLVTAFARF